IYAHDRPYPSREPIARSQVSAAQAPSQ
ncbi:hypothetical protein D049_1509B, partial [Vibrio parahaemolyticus VPTS-2010]